MVKRGIWVLRFTIGYIQCMMRGRISLRYYEIRRNDIMMQLSRRDLIYRLVYSGMRDTISDGFRYFISSMGDEIDWTHLSTYQCMHPSVVEEYADQIKWTIVSHWVKDPDFVRRFADKLDWSVICCLYKLSSPFLDEFADLLDWVVVSRCQNMSHDFMTKFADRLDWTIISSYQILDETTLWLFIDRIDWDIAPAYQKLTENIIVKVADRINWHLVDANQNISDDLRTEYKNNIDRDTPKKYIPWSR